MKTKELQKIEPLKYNGFFSVHNAKSLSKEKINNLPMISRFSRNFNKNINKLSFIFKTQNKYNKNPFINYKEFDNNLEKVPYPIFSKLTHHLKFNNFKNKTKINNQLSSSNKVKEVYFDINKTEYNTFSRKCFSIDVKNNLKQKSQTKLLKMKKDKMVMDELLEKEKQEFRKTITVPRERNKFINNFSYIIYNHFYPYNTSYNNTNSNYLTYNHNSNGKKNLKLQITNNVNDNKNINVTEEKTNALIKNNTFFEMIIEKVIHLVEYKNQLNQEISINVVKNLLNEEINSIWNGINGKKNNNSKITYINKSTSTDENGCFDFKLLNSTYDKYDRYSNTSVSEINIEKKAKMKLEKKIAILNKKYGFSDKNYLLLHYDIKSNNSDNIDNCSQCETENIIKSKMNHGNEDVENFIMSRADNINDNLDNFKKQSLINDYKSFIKNSNIKDVLGQFLMGKNNLNKKQGLHIFKNTEQYLGKKNIDFNDYANNVLELYKHFLQIKEMRERMMKENQDQIQNQKKIFRKKNENTNLFSQNGNNSNSNSLNNLNKNKEKNSYVRPKISSNFDDLFSFIKTDVEFQSFLNQFGGYYSFGEEKNIKEILQKIKEEQKLPDYSNINKYKSSKTLHTSNFNNDNINNGTIKYTSQKFVRGSTKSNINVNKNNENDNVKKNEINENDESFVNDDDNEKHNNVDNADNDNIENDNNNDNVNDNNDKEIINSNLIINNEDFKIEKSKEEIGKTKEKTKKEKIIKNNKNESKNKFNMNNYMNNHYLNELEKEFLKQTNNLNALDEKDKQQMLKYLNAIQSYAEFEKSGNLSIHNKMKINNIHYQIEQFILGLFKRGIIKRLLKEKGSKDIFAMLKNRDFYEKQRRVLMEEEEEEEDWDTEDKNNNQKGNTDNDDDFDFIFQKGKKRSVSVDYTKFRGYSKLFYKLLYRKIKKKKYERTYSGKKKLNNNDWRSLLKKRYRRNFKKKTTMLRRKKRKTIKIRIQKHKFMVDEFKDMNPLEHNYIEDEEVRAFQEEERQKRLKQELIDKKMNDFFRKIQRLKKGGLDNFEKELELLVEEQLERLDYTKEKENESRVNNFIQDFDLSRSKDKSTQKFRSQRMHYLSPIIFFTNRKRNNSNEDKK